LIYRNILNIWPLYFSRNGVNKSSPSCRSSKSFLFKCVNLVIYFPLFVEKRGKAWKSSSRLLPPLSHFRIKYNNINAKTVKSDADFRYLCREKRDAWTGRQCKRCAQCIITATHVHRVSLILRTFSRKRGRLFRCQNIDLWIISNYNKANVIKYK